MKFYIVGTLNTAHCNPRFTEIIAIPFQYLADIYGRKQKYFLSQAHMLLYLKADIFSNILFDWEDCSRIKLVNFISDVSLTVWQLDIFLLTFQPDTISKLQVSCFFGS